MVEYDTIKQVIQEAEKGGRSFAHYLVREIMPNIVDPDPLNCLLSTLTLIYHRIISKNKTKPIRQILKNDPLIN